MPRAGGPLPKDPEKRLRRNEPTFEQVDIFLGAKKVRAPALPARGGRKGWSAATRRWYKVWADSPMASMFGPTDWQRLHVLAHLVQRYFDEPSAALMAEIRQNEAKLGGTPEDRMRLRWRIRPGKPEEEPAQPEEKPKAGRRRKAGGRPDPRLQLVEPGPR